MAKLKSRDKFIPGGFRFFQPETNFRIPPGSSFDTVVQAVVAHRAGNAFLARKHGWALDYQAVADEVDRYNAQICLSHGWRDYVLEGGGQPSTPFPSSSPTNLSRSAKHVVVGASTIAEMFGDEGPVGRPDAEARAKVCQPCPMNARGDWTRFFTVPAAAAIRSMLGMVTDLRLETPQDEDMRICEACGCPLKLKIWARLGHILKHMPKEDHDSLDPKCWILAEEKAHAPENQRGTGDPPAGTNPGNENVLPAAKV